MHSLTSWPYFASDTVVRLLLQREKLEPRVRIAYMDQSYAYVLRVDPSAWSRPEALLYRDRGWWDSLPEVKMLS